MDRNQRLSARSARLLRVLRVEVGVFVVVLLVAAIVGWLGSRASADGEPGYEVIAADDLEPFRTAFNANPDQVRLVLLVGPT